MSNVSRNANYRHANYYRIFAAHVGTDAQALGQEFDQIRKALEWLMKQMGEEEGNLFCEFLPPLQAYLKERSLYHELLKYGQHGLQFCRKFERHSGWMLLLCFEAYYALGEWHDAYQTAQRAVEVTRTFDESLHAKSLFALGRLQFNQGSYSEALSVLGQAEALQATLGELDEVANTKAEVAAYYLNRHELDRALELYLEVDQLRKRANPSQQSSHTLLMLGVVYRRKGELEKAKQYLHRTRSEGWRKSILMV